MGGQTRKHTLDRIMIHPSSTIQEITMHETCTAMYGLSFGAISLAMHATNYVRMIFDDAAFCGEQKD